MSKKHSNLNTRQLTVIIAILIVFIALFLILLPLRPSSEKNIDEANENISGAEPVSSEESDAQNTESSGDGGSDDGQDGQDSESEGEQQGVSSEPEVASVPMIALTFDDGPYSPVTDRIIARLNEYGGRATFFVVGNRVATYHASVESACSSGFEIGNHTWDHTTLTSLSVFDIMREIRDTENVVTYYTGSTPTLVRPVGGSHDDTVDAAISRPMITWSIDTQDWKSRNAQSVIQKTLDSVYDGCIVLMHDLYPSTADACDVIIPELVARGYTLVTVSELAEARGVRLETGSTYSSFRP